MQRLRLTIQSSYGLIYLLRLMRCIRCKQITSSHRIGACRIARTVFLYQAVNCRVIKFCAIDKTDFINTCGSITIISKMAKYGYTILCMLFANDDKIIPNFPKVEVVWFQIYKINSIILTACQHGRVTSVLDNVFTKIALELVNIITSIANQSIIPSTAIKYIIACATE